MIVDCHTHTWDSIEQLGRCVPPHHRQRESRLAPPASNDSCTPLHLESTDPVDATIVLGFKSRFLDANIPNNQVAAYVGTHPDRLIGFAGIDPSEPKEAIEEIQRARTSLGMKGIAVAPPAQDFHPSNSQAMLVYGEAERHELPIVFHAGVHLATAAKLEYARPFLLDEVARELPNARMVIAHMGFPWINETLMLLAKHEHVFADTSRLLDQPWAAYQALLSAHQFGVMDKLLFASGFPNASASHSIEALYGINHLVHGTNLPTIPREQLRGIVERDTLSLLGIPWEHRPVQQQPASAELGPSHN